MAGTTIHDESSVAKSFQFALNKHGYNFVTLEEANQKMGYSKPQAIRELLEIHEPTSERITEELVMDIHAFFVSEMVSFFPPKKPALATILTGLPAKSHNS